MEPIVREVCSLVFSLSSHRHPSICILFNYHFTSYNKHTKTKRFVGRKDREEGESDWWNITTYFTHCIVCLFLFCIVPKSHFTPRVPPIPNPLYIMVPRYHEGPSNSSQCSHTHPTPIFTLSTNVNPPTVSGMTDNSGIFTTLDAFYYHSWKEKFGRLQMSCSEFHQWMNPVGRSTIEDP